jgi:hypothetical protein
MSGFQSESFQIIENRQSKIQNGWGFWYLL